MRAVRHWRTVVETMQRLARGTEELSVRVARLQKLHFMVVSMPFISVTHASIIKSSRGRAVVETMQWLARGT